MDIPVQAPDVDRYKTVSLKTLDRTEARTKAWRQFTDVEFRLEHGVPVFNRPFSQVGREGREIVVLFVHGKDKSRNLVASSGGDYLERIRAVSKAAEQDDRVLTTITDQPNKSLSDELIGNSLAEAGLRIGASGIPRSIHCFRHTHAMFRLAGVHRRLAVNPIARACAQSAGSRSLPADRRRVNRSRPSRHSRRR